MNIHFIGDVHGMISNFKQILDIIPDEDIIVQVGDLGAGFVDIPKFKSNVYWIRGNHDDPEISREHSNYLGDWGCKIFDNTTIFYLGGAWSIDKEWRIAQMKLGSKPIWWADEELSDYQLGCALEMYRTIKPDIMITHEAPFSIVPLLINSGIVISKDSPLVDPNYFGAKLDAISTRTNIILQHMLSYHKPKLWIFGHFHVSKDIVIEGTRFICCAELAKVSIDTNKL